MELEIKDWLRERVSVETVGVQGFALVRAFVQDDPVRGQLDPAAFLSALEGELAQALETPSSLEFSYFQMYAENSKREILERVRAAISRPAA